MNQLPGSDVFALTVEAFPQLGLAAVGWFCLSAAAMGALDISMPRKDTISVGAVLDVVALIVAGVPAALLTAMCGVVGSWAYRERGPDGLRGLAFSLFARVMGVILALVPLIIWGTPGLPLASSWPAIAVAVAVYLGFELVLSETLTARAGGRRPSRAIVGGIGLQWPLLLAQASSALLTVVIYPTLGSWSLPLAIALLLLIRQSYAFLLEMRETFRTTVEVLVEAAEGAGADRQGHAERTARLARTIAGGCGLSAADVDRIAYAALLHDIGEIGDGCRSEQRGGASAVIAGVHFFADIEEIILICDGRADELSASASEVTRLAAFIVALASDIDERTRHLGENPNASHAARIASQVPPQLKARAVAAAVRLGYGTPALT